MENAFTWIVFAISLGLTSWHLFEEQRGKLWRYFGAIAGVRIADGLGRLIFTVILGIVLLTAAILGIPGLVFKWVAPEVSLVALGFLIGGRISDWWYSHYRLQRKGYVSNPGLRSSWFYLLDAAILIAFLYAHSQVLESGKLALSGGLFTGWLTFFIVLPAVRWFGKRFPKSLLTPWKAEDPVPEWV